MTESEAAETRAQRSAGLPPAQAGDQASQDQASQSGSIQLRLRVGITGHRHIDSDHPGLAPAIAAAVEYITLVLAVDPARLKAADPGPIRPDQIVLTAVSSLAEGADRVVADELLKRQGAQLEAVLPLAPVDYRHDFGSPESVEQFNQLAARAVRADVMLTARSRKDAYEQAGRAVVDRSDAMIVVWDGEPARGRGGTAEIYDYAVRWHKPILLIHIDDHWARLDTGHLPLAARGTIPLLPSSLERLDQYNRERLSAAVMARTAPLLAQVSSRPWLESAALQIEHFSRYFARADWLARRFQRRWLWAMRSLYVLAPLAVLVVAAQVNFAPSQEHYAWFEFGILVLVTLLLIAARRQHWHESWISARYLAEQIRSLFFLGLTGVTTPEQSATAPYRKTVDGVEWTERAASEVWFSRPAYTPPADITLLADVLCEEWIGKQQEYHVKVNESFRRRRDRIHALAVGLFIVSAAAALLHSLDVGSTGTQQLKWWDFLAIAVPAVAAALGGYGAQRDYLRHAERSKLFAALLDDAAVRLASAQQLQDIQQTVVSVSRAMRSEATDWYSIVRSQDVELPS